MRRWIPPVFATAILLLGPSAEAHAHGLVRYASTPVSPPVELLWVLPSYFLAFVLVNAFLGRRHTRLPMYRQAVVAIGFLAAFSISFLFMGGFLGVLLMVDSPGGPCHAFWGYGFADSGGTFLFWNIAGLFFLFMWSLVFVKPWRTDTGELWLIVVANIALYCVFLLPFAVSGGWTHGWAGSYVHSGCTGNLYTIDHAIEQYANEHEGFLPKAGDVDELLRELWPNAQEDRHRRSRRVDVCPLGRAFDRRPMPYEWDPELSGMHILVARAIGSDGFFVKCPYHSRWDPIHFIEGGAPR